MINKNIIYLIFGIVIGVLSTFGIIEIIEINNPNKISADNAVKHDVHSLEIDDEKIVKLNGTEIKELGIVLSKVGPQNIELYNDLTGEVVSDPDQLAHIVPRFNGIVKNVFKKIGDRVKKNEVIAVIESNESLTTYDVESSIDGVVLNMHLTPGELIGDDDHVVTIADLNSVWAELNVYQKDLQKIKINQKVELYVDILEKTVSGKIFYLSPTVDEHTRTAIARVRLNNYNGYWKPGMFLNARVLIDKVPVEKAISLSSIQNYDGEKVVFVKNENGFVPRVVTIGKVNSNFVEILKGLEDGETYVAEGAFVIKSELLKESFGGGHSH